MHTLYHSLPQKVSKEVILFSVALLFGIIILLTGYYRSNDLLFDIGLLIVLGGVFTGIFFLFMAGKK